MSTALEPRLTSLDERVLNALPRAGTSGVRCAVIVDRVYPRANRYDGWMGVRVRESDMREIRGILRGLEHLGKATGRGGWWKRA